MAQMKGVWVNLYIIMSKMVKFRFKMINGLIVISIFKSFCMFFFFEIYFIHARVAVWCALRITCRGVDVFLMDRIPCAVCCI